MWHAYNVIAKGDQLRASAVRSVACVSPRHPSDLIGHGDECSPHFEPRSPRGSRLQTSHDRIVDRVHLVAPRPPEIDHPGRPRPVLGTRPIRRRSHFGRRRPVDTRWCDAKHQLVGRRSRRGRLVRDGGDDHLARLGEGYERERPREKGRVPHARLGDREGLYHYQGRGRMGLGRTRTDQGDDGTGQRRRRRRDRLRRRCVLPPAKDTTSTLLTHVTRETGVANICIITNHTTIIRQRIDVPVPRKRKGGGTALGADRVSLQSCARSIGRPRLENPTKLTRRPALFRGARHIPSSCSRSTTRRSDISTLTSSRCSSLRRPASPRRPCTRF